MRSLRIAVVLVILSWPVAHAATYYTTTVSDGDKQFAFSGGESQSAVVPAGKKNQCPNGRVIVTDDWRRPPLRPVDVPRLTTNVAHWRNLSGPTNIVGPGQGVSIFSAPPNVTVGGGPMMLSRPRLWAILGADHRLVALPNGDLLYQRLTHMREPFTPKPKWFDVTFRVLKGGHFGGVGEFGPGARGSLATWRSTDCGLTFQYFTDIDTLAPENLDCANPQPKDQSLDPNFDMGGTDGSNLVVGRDGTAYAAVGCFGREFADIISDQPKLASDRVDKTYLFSWKPGASKFSNRGFYKPKLWGPQIVPLSATRMAVAVETGIKIGTATSATSAFTFPETPDKPDGVGWGWTPGGNSPPESTGLPGRIGGNYQGSTLLARVPGKGSSKVLIAFPNTIDGVHGFRLFFYDPDQADAAQRFEERDSVLPRGSKNMSSAMHLTAVDPGEDGPLLLYWYDLDGSTMTARIRGRVIYDENNETLDFDISPAAFDLTPPREPVPTPQNPNPKPSRYFYGDYHTAGGFRRPGGGDTITYRYYPMWVQPWTQPAAAGEPGGSVHYAEVTVTRTEFDFERPGEPPLQSVPPEKVFGECCDFIQFLERVDARTAFPLTNAVAERLRTRMVSTLVRADPNLRDARRRIPADRTVTRRPHRAVRAPLQLSPAFLQAEEEHLTESRDR